MKQYVQIIDDYKMVAVKTFNVSGKSEKQIEKLIRGIEINLNHEDFVVVEVDENHLYKEDV